MDISKEAKRILNDERLINHRDMWINRMQNLFDNKPDKFNDENVIGVFGAWGTPSDPGLMLENPELWVKEALESIAEQAEACFDENNYCPLCIEFGLYGVHFVGSIFGADVFFQDGNWYSRYLTNAVGELKEVDLDKSETWQIVKRAAHEFVRQDVKLPFFALPTIASALVVAVNLYGDEILMEMLADPDAAKHDLQIINDTLCKMHSELRNILPEENIHPVLAFERTQPPGYGQLCGCTNQLVSAEVYKELIAPLDDALLAQYPKGGMMHLCGTHDHLIPIFRDMPHLKTVQINDRASEDLEKYYTGLRPDQIIYFMPCEEMTIAQALQITGGNRLVIQKPPAATVKK